MRNGQQLPDVSIVPFDPAAAGRTVSHILDENEIHVSGKRVLVKPNMVGCFRPEQGVTTSPLLVRAVVEALLARGAEVVVGDNTAVNAYGMNERAAELTGLLDASLGCFRNIGTTPLRRRIDGNRLSGDVVMSAEVMDAEVVISLPKFKTNLLVGISGAIKNCYGYLCGGDKSRLHCEYPRPEIFSEVILEIMGLRPPDLTIVDAITGMEGIGPIMGRSRTIDRLIFSKSPISADLAVSRLMGYSDDDTPLLAAAKRTLDIESWNDTVAIHGGADPISGFRLPPRLMRTWLCGRLNQVGFRVSRPTLAIDAERCTACKLCEEICPTGCMARSGDSYVIDKDECIQCFCCQEACPEQAVKIEGNIFNFLRGIVRP